MGFRNPFARRNKTEGGAAVGSRELRRKKINQYYAKKNGGAGTQAEDKRQPGNEQQNIAAGAEEAPKLGAESKEHIPTTVDPSATSPVASMKSDAETAPDDTAATAGDEKEVETYQPPRIAAAKEEAGKRKAEESETATVEEEQADERDPQPESAKTTTDTCNMCGCFN